MAERRMFAKTIIDSDAFLEMPHSTQLLYFHLSMRADDDGFINNPKNIMRMVSCKDDDMKLLFAKKFVIPFESGVCVIKHWKIHNYIKNDRYNETKYKKEKAQLILDENKSYKLVKTNENTECIQSGSKVDTQVRLGKVRLGKVNNTCSKNEQGDELFNAFWSEYPKKVGKGAAEKSWNKIKPNKELTDKMIKAIQRVKYSPQWTKDGGQFIPNPVTWLNQKRWEDGIDEPDNDQDKNYDKEFAEWTL